MKQILLASVLLLAATPLFAQDEQPLEDQLLDFFGELTDPLLPLIEDLTGQIQDLSNYHAPEVLPNGDILIRKRKREDVEPEAVPDVEDQGDGMIDL